MVGSLRRFQSVKSVLLNVFIIWFIWMWFRTMFYWQIALRWYKKSLAIDQEGALRTNVRAIGPEEIHSASRSKYMWAYEREIPYVVQRDGFVKHIVCLGNCQTGGQPFVHILIIIVKLSGSRGLILSDNLEQFSHKYCEHCFLFACTVYKERFYLMVKGKKRFLKSFIDYFKHISRCPGVNSSNTVITKWFKNRLAGVCHFISQKNIKPV